MERPSYFLYFFEFVDDLFCIGTEDYPKKSNNIVWMNDNCCIKLSVSTEDIDMDDENELYKVLVENGIL